MCEALESNGVTIVDIDRNRFVERDELTHRLLTLSRLCPDDRELTMSS